MDLTLEISDLLLEQITDIGNKHRPNEFGGFLIGHYSEDLKRLLITDMILPEKYKATPYLFERDTRGIDERLRSFFKQDPKKYYVGEWHTHPNSLPIPSTTDRNAMQTIINHEDVSIKNPVLLIVGYVNHCVELGFYIASKNKLYRYEDI